MSPRYHKQRKVRYNSNKGFNEDDAPLIVNKDFHDQYKRNMDLTNKAYNTDPTSKPKLGSSEFHKLNAIGLEKA